MSKFADIEDIKFRYEVAGHSIKEIAADLRLNLEALTSLVRDQEWTKGELPQADASEDEVDEYYKVGRMRLTALMTRRALRVCPKLLAIEDSVIDAVEVMAKDFDTDGVDAAQDLTKLMTAYTKLMDKQVLLHEAIATPAMADKKLERLIRQSALGNMLDDIDGKGRTLPSEDEDA